jgi:hypothetical protein
MMNKYPLKRGYTFFIFQVMDNLPFFLCISKNVQYFNIVIILLNFEFCQTKIILSIYSNKS